MTMYTTYLPLPDRPLGALHDARTVYKMLRIDATGELFSPFVRISRPLSYRLGEETKETITVDTRTDSFWEGNSLLRERGCWYKATSGIHTLSSRAEALFYTDSYKGLVGGEENQFGLFECTVPAGEIVLHGFYPSSFGNPKQILLEGIVASCIIPQKLIYSLTA